MVGGIIGDKVGGVIGGMFGKGLSGLVNVMVYH